jgi:ABC-type multidrug transport system ATPase subunit
MIGCQGLSVQAGQRGPKLLQDVSASFPEGHLNALVGPSGCGKTTLLKAFLGLVASEGGFSLANQSKKPGQAPASDLAFVPQFSVAHDGLGVEESLRYAYKLTVRENREGEATIARILQQTGLEEHRAKLVSDLSGGQTRRLGLALELVGNPRCLLCDEVTSGLDPLSEDRILALLRSIVDSQGKTVLCTIHNLGKLPDFDHITVLYEGRLVFQGDFPSLQRWFGIEDPLRLYHALDGKEPGHWVERWEAEGVALPESKDAAIREHTPETPPVASIPAARPGAFSQLFTLLHRRYRLLLRDTGYLWLLLALTIGFPCIVVIFAIKGLPQIEGLSLQRSGSFIQQLQGDLRYQMEAAETATLVTGLVMFQVVLLTLMGANNGSREIAAERRIFEKERLKGLRCWVYGLAKLVFTGSIALVQGLWMALFVKVVCQFPGAYFPQLSMMALCCIAMTFVCLGLSAVLSSAERASLLGIYLVGFQLPLSGVVLALPDAVVWILRPLINAYWSWAGYFGSMKDYQVFDAYRMGELSWLPGPWPAAIALLLHIALGVALVLFGVRRRRWN